MVVYFATSKVRLSSSSLPRANRGFAGGIYDPAMDDDDQLEPIQLRGWLKALGKTQAELAKETGINEGYISQLVSGKKTNPGRGMTAKIARCLKIPEGSLFKPPPSPGVLSRLSPAHIEALATLMEQFGLQDSPSPPRDPKTRR